MLYVCQMNCPQLWLCVQVRMSVNRNQDLRMNAGRATIDLEYDIGFDDSGKIHVSIAACKRAVFAHSCWWCCAPNMLTIAPPHVPPALCLSAGLF